MTRSEPVRAEAAGARRPLEALPRLGVGLGYRPEIMREIMAHCSEIDVLEVLADRAVKGSARDRAEIRDLAAVFPVIPHGVNLSIGSVDCLEDAAYLRSLGRLVRATRAPYYSDHAAFTKFGGRSIGHLSPLWRTEEQLRVLETNIRAVQRLLKKPLVLETITVPFDIPGSQMGEAEFLNRLTASTGCGLLVDLANVFINSVNHRFDAERFLGELDAASVVQFHLAGGVRRGAAWIDTHSAPVPPQVWRLLAAMAPRCPNLKAVIIERDSNFGDFGALLEEVRKVRSIWTA